MNNAINISVPGNLSRNPSIFLKSMTVKLGGNCKRTAPSLFEFLRGDILSRNISKSVIAPFLTSNLFLCVIVSGTFTYFFPIG
jgi:hypothetical protein